MFKSALLILSGRSLSSITLLVRNLLVARLISVEDYGIAATFALSMAIVEMMTALGLNQLIIQDTDGNDPRLQSGLQGFHLFRSLFSSAILFFLAYPIADFLGIPEIAWAYQVLALMPVINGLTHFDIYRLQRRMVYMPSLVSLSVPAVISVALVWPFWSIFGDYRVMLYAILVQGVATMITSHLVAERPYRVTFDTGIIRHSLRFGWPLLINNILLFLIFQGEKIIVGRELGIETLALFAMGYTLTLTPSLLLTGTTHTFFLPQLSSSRGKPEDFSHLAMTTFQVYLLFSGLFVIGIMLLGKPVVNLLLGDKYADLVPLLTWLAILHSMRLFKGGSSVISLSAGRTSNALIANIVRVVGIPISWYAAVTSGDVLVVIWIATASELVSFFVSLLLLQQRLRLSLAPIALPVLLTLLLLFFAGWHAWISSGTLGHTGSTYWATGLVLVLFLASLATMKDLRRYVAHRKIISFGE